MPVIILLFISAYFMPHNKLTQPCDYCIKIVYLFFFQFTVYCFWLVFFRVVLSIVNS